MRLYVCVWKESLDFIGRMICWDEKFNFTADIHFHMSIDRLKKRA